LIIGKDFKMRLAIMQPYFFPYLGYFSLIENTDKWVVLDDVQFIRHGWIERNRILKPFDGWQYINVPLEKHSRETSIKEIRIRNSEDWKDRIFRQLEHYKKIAPYYSKVIEFLKETFDLPYTSITKQNTHLLSTTCEYLGITFNYQIFSEMNLDIDKVNGPGDWALNISKAMNASEYINPYDGIKLFNTEEFKSAGIKLKFLKNKLTDYSQGNRTFERGLSIIDVMMFNSLADIHLLLDQLELIH
jgi:hypothetical protein